MIAQSRKAWRPRIVLWVWIWRALPVYPGGHNASGGRVVPYAFNQTTWDGDDMCEEKKGTIVSEIEILDLHRRVDLCPSAEISSIVMT